MRTLLNGFSFVIRTGLAKNPKAGAAYELKLPDDSTIPCRVYHPQKSLKGLIVSLTGFSVKGYEDNRIAVVNNAFAALGFMVITPQIKTIDALHIHPEAVGEVEVAIKAIKSDTTLNPMGLKPALFAPSFTAGIAAIAATKLPADTLSAMCLLGAYCEFETTILFALANVANEDDYGMHILLKNFMKYSIGHQPGMETLVQTALEDNGLKRTKPHLPEMLKDAKPDDAAQYLTFINEAKSRKEMLEQAFASIPDFENWRHSLDLSKHAHEIKCPVVIIHGKDDIVIPAEQSKMLFAILEKENPKNKLVVSSLLSHGDPKLTLEIFKEVVVLSRAFGSFINYAEGQKE